MRSDDRGSSHRGIGVPMRKSVSCHRVDLQSRIVDTQARNIGDELLFVAFSPQLRGF